ncbi:hypothetical protein AYI68_g3926 [Smittium mucronatum]|uniref:Uncharacterized protein n=1 Tax=Smittium mucronatum TaxID=133383 RepID=A0A1R0GYI8_9FUNG|nr:hypothetical protein AYI68_g3926 [Smittium mucronatum]
MYQYALRLYRSYIINGDLQDGPSYDIAKINTSLDLQLQALLLSIQALEVSNQNDQTILVRGSVNFQSEDDLIREGNKRKHSDSFSNFNHSLKNNISSEVTSIVYLKDIKSRYEIVLANKKILNLLKEKNTLACDRLIFVKNPYDVYEMLIDHGFVNYAINFSSKLDLDFKYVISKLVKLNKKNIPLAAAPYLENRFNSSAASNPDCSINEMNINYHNLQDALKFYEHNILESPSSKAKKSDLLLILVDEILNFFSETPKISNDLTRGRTSRIVETPSSLILPNWLVDKLFDGDAIGLIRCCYKHDAIFEGSEYLLRLIKREATNIQMNTEINKFTNIVYLPHNLINEIKFKLDDILKELESNLAKLDSDESAEENKQNFESDLKGSYKYYIDYVLGISKDIENSLTKYLNYVKRESNDLYSIQPKGINED